ncbi:MAG: hypothetical protein IV090_19030 [Candidatus Sericytochromatia bacterium]|nr:hypothetical protein [Candidatus Sericytochromatia bacterium]
MRLFCPLLLALSLVFQSWILPVSAVETLSPEKQGVHFQLLQVDWGGTAAVNVAPVPELLPSLGMLTGGWAVGTVAYILVWSLLHFMMPVLGYSPAVREIGAISASVLTNAGFIWMAGNEFFASQGFEGDLGMTLAGALIGQSLYLFQDEVPPLQLVAWIFSTWGGFWAYNASLQEKQWQVGHGFTGLLE